MSAKENRVGPSPLSGVARIQARHDKFAEIGRIVIEELRDNGAFSLGSQERCDKLHLLCKELLDAK